MRRRGSGFMGRQHRSVLLAACLAAGLAAGAGRAQESDQAQRWCAGADMDERIAGCTSLISSGRESGGALANTFVNRARAYHETEQYERAVADFDQAIRLSPNDPLAHYGRGLALERLGRYTDAIPAFDAAIRLDPGYAAALN